MNNRLSSEAVLLKCIACWPMSRFLGFSQGITSLSLASTNTCMPFTMFWYITCWYSRTSSGSNFTLCIILICFRNVDFPLSPAPSSNSLTCRRSVCLSFSSILSISLLLYLCSISSGESLRRNQQVRTSVQQVHDHSSLAILHDYRHSHKKLIPNNHTESLYLTFTIHSF